MEGDGPAQSLQAEPRISKKCNETGQLNPYRLNRASPRSGRRRASSVPTATTEPLQEVEGDEPAQSLQAEPSLSKKWKETGQLNPHSPNRASPRSVMRRASSILTATTEPLQEVEGDEPAQSLQAEPSLSKKWKETGQLSPNRRNRASPRSGRRRTSSVLTGGTEPLQEVEGDWPAQSLQAEPRISKKWKQTGQLRLLQAEPRISKKWKETGQLSPYRRNRASPRSGRRWASSVLTGGAEKLQDLEGDGPAQSLHPQPSLSKKWKETGQLSPYRRNRASPRSGRRRASSVPQPQQSLSKKWKETGQLSPYRRSRESPRSGRRRASSVLTKEPSLSQKWKETGQLCPHSPNRPSPRSGRRRASSVLTGGAEKLQEVEGDWPAQSLQAEPRISKKWKQTGQLRLLQAEPRISKKWKETGQLSPYRRNRASPRSGRRWASSVLTG